MLVSRDEKWGQNASVNFTALRVCKGHMHSSLYEAYGVNKNIRVFTFILLMFSNLPAEKVTFATVHGWGRQQGETVRVTVARTWPREADSPLASRHGTPADG